MKNRISTGITLLAVALAVPSALQAQLVWDTSTDTSYQNGNGTWGTDNFWTTTTGGSTLTGWTLGQTAWFGGNATVAATPTGNFTVTVDGTQTAASVRQIQNGDGNYTLTGGTLALGDGGVRVDRGTMTINSTITDSDGSTLKHLNVQSGTLILGGNNTFASKPQIRGVSGGTVRINNAGALGTGSTVQFVNGGVTLDLNGLDISGKNITIDNNQTAFLGNTAATKSIWSGNVDMSIGSLRAGGTGAELEISGIVSGTKTMQSMDGGVLRLTGNNTYNGGTSVRDDSTLIVGHENALGSKSATIAYIGTRGTLDLNGFDVGSQAITLQQNTSKLINNDTAAAANVGGAITLQRAGSSREIGGAGDLTLGGAIGSDANVNGFTKVGTGTLTLGGINTYTGSTAVNAGGLIINGSQSNGAITVSADAFLGGDGTVGGNIVFADNAKFLFDAAATLAANGSSVDLGNLSVASLIGLDNTVSVQTYTLIDGTATFDFTDVQNMGVANAYDLGGGKSAYFEEGSLKLVVIPEPATIGVLTVGALVIGFIRRCVTR